MIKTHITSLIRARIRILEAKAEEARTAGTNAEYNGLRNRIEGLHDALDIVIWEYRAEKQQ